MALVAEYGFSEGSGTTAADSSGGGHPLTIASGAATWATGHTGAGLAGNTSGVGGVNTSLSNPTSNVTIMAWVKPHTVSGAEEPLLGYWSSPSSDPNGSSQCVLYATRSAFGTANKLVGNLRIGGTLGEIVGPALTADTWVHVALAFDGTTISLFVNGALFTSVTRAGTLGVGSFGVAGRSDATVDDVRAFNTALTASQVTTWMNSPAGVPPHGSGSGALTYVGAASGHESPHGTATGAAVFAGSASGHTTMNGAATGSYVFAGAAAGHAQPHGAATGTLTYAGAASGTTDPHGAAAGVFDYDGSASGHTDPAGTASGELDYAGTASGHAPSIGIPHGDATGSIAYTGTASGHVDRHGAAVGVYRYAGTAHGTGATTRRDITLTVTPLPTRWATSATTDRWSTEALPERWRATCLEP